ncbi:fimbrial protein [Petrimonas sp.]|uniref:fimbrial protein n=1 Tax=Petrimonas sp. TaxID=2023866 RepID=UPI003F511225
MNKTLYIITVNLALLFSILATSCAQQDVLTEEVNSSPVFLNVSLRSQGNAPSLNQDETDLEDYVKNIAVIVFQTSSNKKLGEYYEYTTNGISGTFTFKLEVGRGDFFFIANTAKTEAEFKVMSRANLEAFLQSLNNFPYVHGLNATDPYYFPMSRVYTNQLIPKGGTEADPVQFLPDGNTRVELIRTIAKVEINISGEYKDNVTNVELVNGVNQFSFVKRSDNAGMTLRTTDNAFYRPDATNQPNLWRFYTPEVNFTTQPTWGTNPQNLNYIKISTDFGRDYLLPIVSNSPKTGDYLAFATGQVAGTSPNYSIIRNDHYKFDVEIKPKELNVSLNILPWELISSKKEFRPYTEMEYLPTWNPEPPVVKQPYNAESGAVYDVATFTFNLLHPIGGIWKATLTNGLEFAFEPGSPTTGTSGIDYQIKIVALKPPTTTVHTTEFYLMINGVEVDPDTYIEGGTLVNGPKGIGQGNRFVIIQSAQ